MANRNYNRKQALEKEVKEIYAEIGIAATSVPPSLGSAGTFAVLGGSTVTNTGSSVLTGDLGVSPGSAITGFPPGTYSGTLHSNDATAIAAQVALTAAYVDLQSRPFTTDLSGIDLGGLTLSPGVYKFSTSAQLTGTLTLDGGGNSNAVWVFQIGSTLTTASASSIVLINSGVAGNVFFQVGSSATLGTTTTFRGNILAQASITLTTGASMQGSALARTGAVTLDTNNVAIAASSGTPATQPTLVRGLGVASVTRSSAGLYVITLQDKYMRLMQADVSIQSSAAIDLRPQLVSENVSSAKTVVFRTIVGSVATDSGAAITVRVFLNLKNSSV